MSSDGNGRGQESESDVALKYCISDSEAIKKIFFGHLARYEADIYQISGKHSD
jgi:hypothetical protein